MFGLFSKSATTSSTVNLAAIEAAQERIKSYLNPSPLTFSPRLSELVGHQIYLKWDSQLRTGSFKERGALNLLLSLNEQERRQGVCAASLGNHALGLSYFAAKLGVPCCIVMPSSAPLVKVQACKNTGAEIVLQGKVFDEAYSAASQLAAERKMRFVPAFDDPLIIAGQGTSGLEMLAQCPDFDSVVVPFGGGGLLSGVATALKEKRPELFVLGVRSRWTIDVKNQAPEIASSVLRLGTIADGIAVKYPGKITSPIIERFVNKTCVVDESALAYAVMRFLELERSVVEGAGAAGLAALLQRELPSRYSKTIILVSGSNIDLNLLSRLIERDMAERQRLLRMRVSVPDQPGLLHTVSGLIAGQGANVLQVQHDRSFSHIPGNVDITFLLEVRDLSHKHQVLETLRKQGVTAQEIVGDSIT
jgi:threonine dehydratase